MKTKTGIRAGENGGAGGETVLTAETIQQAVASGIVEAGLPELQRTVEEVQARQRTLEGLSGDPGNASWWVNDEVFHSGICSNRVRESIKDRVRADHSAYRGEDEAFPGQNAARSMRAVLLSAVSMKDPGLAGCREALSPVQFAEALYGESHIVTQAMGGNLARHDVASDLLISDDAARIGATIPVEFLAGFLAFLRARSVVLAAGPRTEEMIRGALSFVIQTGGATFGYVTTATSEAPQSSFEFGTADFKARYFKGLVVASIQALRRSNVVNDGVILNEMLAAGGDAFDNAALLGDGTDAEPKGIRNLIFSGHVAAAPVLTAAQNMASRIHSVELSMRLQDNLVTGIANITPSRMVLFMSRREFLYFASGRTDTGALAWPSVESSGTLMGQPIFWTGRIPTDEATPDNIGSTIIAADMPNVVVAEEEGMTVTTSTEATIPDGSGVFSFFTRSSIGYLITAIHDVGMLRDKAGWVLTAVNFGGVDADFGGLAT